MNILETHKQWRLYVEQNSEIAFRELVVRYVDLVFTTALRRVNGNEAMAQDVAQTVFIDLARKAKRLPAGLSLGGWLHRHTCFTASNAMRSELRRQNRERIAVEMNHEQAGSNWNDLALVVDEEVDRLAPPDREAIVLRFFEQCDFRQIGEVIGLSEDAAQKRVSRALDKLKGLLVQRGVAISIAGLSALLAEHAAAAAPPGLAASLSKTALASSGAGIVGALTSLFSSIQAKVAVGLALAALVVIPILSHPKPAAAIPAQAKSTTFLNSISPTNTPASNPEKQDASIAGLPSSLSAVLRLSIVADDSGKPIPNVPLDVVRMEEDNRRDDKMLTSRLGVCEIPFEERTTKSLTITTRIDGFADTRLEWSPENGKPIPPTYILRLTRSAPIGGMVLGPDDQAIANAKVGFNHEPAQNAQTKLESHEFGFIEATTDNEGRWHIDRIAPSMFQRLYGRASHPLYGDSDTLFVRRDAEALKRLQNGTFTFKLAPATVVTGIVVDTEDNPIVNSSVSISPVNQFGNDKTATTTNEGRFTIAGCKLGKSVITAQATGFAAATLPLDVAKGMAPVKLVLSPGLRVWVRIVDAAGKPIPKAYLVYQPGRLASDSVAIRAKFAAHADDEGIVVWNEAPNTDLFFNCSAKGYRRQFGVKLRPDGQVHVITMQNNLTISGTVLDAENTQPMPQFRIICGSPQKLSPGNPSQWSSLDRHWLTFANGQFKYTLEEAIIQDTPNPGYVFKFEADGYAPFVSRTIEPTETEVVLEVKMKPNGGSVITVLHPDGTPACDADVGLVKEGSLLRLANGFFDWQSGGAPILKTNAKGEFHLHREDGIKRIVAIDSFGIGETTPNELAIQPILCMQKFGSLEGTYTLSRKSTAGCALSFGYFGKLDSSSLFADQESFTTIVDEHGRFVFPKLPPGMHTIVKNDTTPPIEGTSRSPYCLKQVEILPGQTNHIDIGGDGYEVYFKIRLIKEHNRDSRYVILGSLNSTAMQPPSEIQSDANALVHWAQNLNLDEIAKTSKIYWFQAGPDGSAVCDAVVPGRYVLKADVFEPGNKTPLGSASLPVTVPSQPANGVLDLGEILVKGN